MFTSIRSSFLAQRYAVFLASTIPGTPSIRMSFGWLPEVASAFLELIKSAANILVMSLVTLV